MKFIFDTHAHYDDKAFDDDRDDILKNLPQKNVAAVVNAGVDIESCEKSSELSSKYDYIYAAVGIHPENVDAFSDFSCCEKILENLILTNKKVVAIGEIGLDYHYKSDNKAKQKDFFESQIKLALKYDLPVLVHDREAHGDTLEILKKYKPKGILHCFSGSTEMAKEIIKLGMYIGLGGAVTFKNAKNVVCVAQSLSLERLVLETDAPYMAPVPFRGKRCDSSYIAFTAKTIAELHNISVEKIYEKTLKNAASVFKINI